MTILGDLAARLTDDLAALDRGAGGTEGSVKSCREELMTSVVSAVGLSAASLAETYADLIDLGCVRALQRTDVNLDAEVAAVVRAYQHHAIAAVVASMRRSTPTAAALTTGKSTVDTLIAAQGQRRP